MVSNTGRIKGERRTLGQLEGGGGESTTETQKKPKQTLQHVLESQDSENRKMKEFTVKNILNNLENMLLCFREQLRVVQCLRGQNHLSVFSAAQSLSSPGDEAMLRVTDQNWILQVL